MAIKSEAATKKDAPAAKEGNQRARFPDPKTSGSAWYAAFHIESAYSKPVSEEDLGRLNKAKERLMASKFPEAKKNELLDYLRVGQEASGGRFSIVQAEAIVSKYLDGAIPDEHLDFEIVLIEAWCGGRLREFLGSQRDSLASKPLPQKEKEELNKMVDLALTRTPILMVIAATTLRIYHPMAAEDIRMDLLGKMIRVLESVAPL